MNPVRTEVSAETHAEHQIGTTAVRELNGNDFAFTFERRTNEHGVAVRRVVIYGPEECDPNASSARRQ